MSKKGYWNELISSYYKKGLDKNNKIVRIDLGLFQDGSMMSEIHGDIYDISNMEKFIEQINERYATDYKIVHNNSNIIIKEKKDISLLKKIFIYNDLKNYTTKKIRGV